MNWIVKLAWCSVLVWNWDKEIPRVTLMLDTGEHSPRIKDLNWWAWLDVLVFQLPHHTVFSVTYTDPNEMVSTGDTEISLHIRSPWFCQDLPKFQFSGGGGEMKPNFTSGVKWGTWSKNSGSLACLCITDSLSHTTYVETNKIYTSTGLFLCSVCWLAKSINSLEFTDTRRITTLVTFFYSLWASW